MIIQIFWVIFIMFIWFNTDAFTQYFKFLNFLQIQKWQNYQSISKISYTEYLIIKHRGFFTKLISCKPCLNFWITLVVCITFNNLNLFPAIYMISYITYKILDKNGII